jgi:hypothetical protein
MMQMKKMEKRIAQIKAELALIGDMRPGSLNQQRTVCGRPNCRCMDPKNPKKHGPYYQLSYIHKGKSTSQFIQKEFVSTVRAQLNNYKTFKALTAEWVDLTLAIAKEKLKCAKEDYKETTQRLKQKQRSLKGAKTRDTAI